MNNKDYKKNLDNIKCTPEFREKMEKMLQGKPIVMNNSEFADSISDVEKAPKRNYGRIVSIAASAAILVGVGGVAAAGLRNGSDEDPATESSQTDTTEAAQDNYFTDPLAGGSKRPYADDMIYFTEHQLIDFAFTNQRDSVLMDSTDMVWDYFDNIPPATASLIWDVLMSADWENAMVGEIPEAESVDELNSMSEHQLTVNFQGDFNFTYLEDETGTAYMLKDDKVVKYQMNNYDRLYDIIAANLLTLDWSYCNYENAGKVTVMLDRYKEQITSTADEYDSSDWLVIFDTYPISAAVNEDGIISISRKCTDGTTVQYNFTSSAEFYKEINGIFADPNYDPMYVEGDPDASVKNMAEYTLVGDDLQAIFVAIHDNEENMLPLYNIDSQAIKDIINSYTWSECELPYNENYYNFGNMSISESGIIYSTINGKAFNAEGQDISKLTDVLHGLCEKDQETYLCYLRASGEKWKNVQGDLILRRTWNLYDEDGSQQGSIQIEGTGGIYYDGTTHSQLSEISSDGYRETYFTNGDSAVIIRSGEMFDKYYKNENDIIEQDIGNHEGKAYISFGEEISENAMPSYYDMCYELEYEMNNIRSLYMINTGYTFTVDDMGRNVGIYIEYNDKGNSRTVQTDIVMDENGNFLKGKIVFLYYDGTTETYFDMTLGDGTSGAIVIDNENFEIPENIASDYISEEINEEY